MQKTDYSIDYYEVLQVSPRATTEEIRLSFKRLVLELHPDKNPDRREWSEKRIRELIEANDILSDADKRQAFDRVRRLGGSRRETPEEPFFFRRNGPGARALMILHLLLHDNAAEAVGILLEQEEKYGTGYLSEFLDRKDYLDCLFLLSEHFLERKNYLQAVERLRTFYRLERQAKYRRHYYDQVLKLLKDLYLRKLPRVLTPEQAIGYLEQALDLQLSQQENLLRLKKVAELQARVGDLNGAKETLEAIHSVDPNVKGLERIEALLAS